MICINLVELLNYNTFTTANLVLKMFTLYCSTINYTLLFDNKVSFKINEQIRATNFAAMLYTQYKLKNRI